MSHFQFSLDKFFHSVIVHGLLCVTFSISTLCGQSRAISKSISIDSNYTVTLSDGSKISGSYQPPGRKMPLIIFVSAPLVSDRRNITNYSSFGIYRFLAQKLGEHGFGAFWFDNRGMGRSQGKHDSITLYTHANDVQEIARHFKKKNPNTKLGLIGLSEGGSVAEVVAASSAKEVGLLILLSTMQLKGYEAFKYQTKTIFLGPPSQSKSGNNFLDTLYPRYDRISESLFKVLELSDQGDTIKKQLKIALANDFKNYPMADKRTETDIQNNLYSTWTQPHQIALRKFKPDSYISQIHCPILALYGEKDELVECSPNVTALEAQLKTLKHTDFSIHSIPGVNHSYRTMAEGPRWQLANKDEFFSQVALDIILKWLASHK